MRIAALALLVSLSACSRCAEGGDATTSAVDAAPAAPLREAAAAASVAPSSQPPVASAAPVVTPPFVLKSVEYRALAALNTAGASKTAWGDYSEAQILAAARSRNAKIEACYRTPGVRHATGSFCYDLPYDAKGRVGGAVASMRLNTPNADGLSTCLTGAFDSLDLGEPKGKAPGVGGICLAGKE